MNTVQLKQIEKRKEIANLSIPIIDKYGFNNISISKLCSKIGISVGSFYHYFKDKNDIIMEFFIMIDTYYKDVVNPLIQDNSNSLESINVFCQHYGIYSTNIGLEICRQISVVPLINYYDEFMSENRYLYTMLFDIIVKGQEDKQITKEFSSDAITNLFLVMIRGYCFDWCKNQGNYDIVQKIDFHSKLLIDQIKL